MDPRDVCRRAECSYDATDKCYTLPVWGEEYAVFPQACRVERTSESRYGIHSYFPLFIVHYLLTVKATGVLGEWISEKDIPGGEGFFRGPHTIPTQPVAHCYQDDTNGFADHCLQLGGTPLDLADASFSFTITPRIPVAILCWKVTRTFHRKADCSTTAALVTTWHWTSSLPWPQGCAAGWQSNLSLLVNPPSQDSIQKGKTHEHIHHPGPPRSEEF